VLFVYRKQSPTHCPVRTCPSLSTSMSSSSSSSLEPRSSSSSSFQRSTGGGACCSRTGSSPPPAAPSGPAHHRRGRHHHHHHHSYDHHHHHHHHHHHPDVVLEAVRVVGVQEAVPHPLPRPDLSTIGEAVVIIITIILITNLERRLSRVTPLTLGFLGLQGATLVTWGVHTQVPTQVTSTETRLLGAAPYRSARGAARRRPRSPPRPRAPTPAPPPPPPASRKEGIIIVIIIIILTITIIIILRHRHSPPLRS
jgi:hypothetical protein